MEGSNRAVHTVQVSPAAARVAARVNRSTARALAAFQGRSDVLEVGCTSPDRFFAKFQVEGHRIFNAKAFKDLFGPVLRDFLRDRPGCRLDVARAAAWGLTDYTGPDPQTAADTTSVHVVRVALGAGPGAAPQTSATGSHITNGHQGVMYGSSTRSNQGQMSEEWFPVHFFTLQVTAPQPGETVSFNFQPEGNVEVSSNLSAIDTLDRAFEWLWAHPGRILRIGGPGARGKSDLSRNFVVPGKLVPFTSKDGKCLGVSALNAAAVALSSPGPVQDALATASAALFVCESFGSIANWYQRFLPVVRLVKVKDVAGVPYRGFDLQPRTLLSLEAGVYIARLIGFSNDGARVDHIVVVDTESRLVYDPMESNAMSLSMASLDCCVGDEAFLCDLQELRRVIVAPRKRSMTDATCETSKKRKSDATSQ